ncbi:hypothetical protein FOL47_001934 [Perkinsus chesapeaki]|uniref:RRM domain-containing protein n=1 Tax=Perkinsus chesapeaki TaxID=330153 RepID=A0A7J6MHY3_PERCH|nr:hypothetical protein FOL47_001934 [Perkinsus chesapeaki]
MRTPDDTPLAATPTKVADVRKTRRPTDSVPGIDVDSHSPGTFPPKSPGDSFMVTPPNRGPPRTISTTTEPTPGGIGSLYVGSPSTSAGGWPSPPTRSVSFGGPADMGYQSGGGSGSQTHSATGKRSNSRSGFRIFCRVDCRASPHRPIPSRETVCNYFSRYGPILDCYLPESATNVAYVCFEDSQSLEEVMNQERPHVVEGTQLTVTRAQPRPDYSVNTDRIFVKHVPDNATRMDLRTYFNTFGEVTDVYIPKDKATGAQRRFAFVTFREVRSARAALGAGRHVLHDQEVQVMPAEARPQSMTPSSMMHSSPSPRPSPNMEPENRTVRSHTDSGLMMSSLRPPAPVVPYMAPHRSERFYSVDGGTNEDPSPWKLPEQRRSPERQAGPCCLPTDDLNEDPHMAALANSVSNLLDSSPSSVGSDKPDDPESVLTKSLRKASDSGDYSINRRSVESPFANAMSPLLSFDDFIPSRLPPSVVRDDRSNPPFSHSSFVL